MMNIKKTFCWLFAICLICQGVAHAQSVPLGPYTSSTYTTLNFQVDAYGTLLSTGPFNSSPTFNSAENASTSSSPQFLWVPALGALRMGSFSSAPSTTNMGEYSFAEGLYSTASGLASFAAGGFSTASGYDSFAGGGGDAMGGGSVAIGESTLANGAASVALGYQVYAYGQYSLATGENTHANGNYSAAFNYWTSASSYESTAFGQYNLNLAEGGGTPSSTAWVGTLNAADPLFEIGDGTSSVPADALVVYKDGNAVFPATASTVTAATFVTTEASGDIPMFTGY